MNTGNSVRDADPRFAADGDLPGLAASADQASSGDEPAVPGRPSFRHVQDIQELIDKLAAVTKQLRHPGHS